ncbi:uncharacterized protein L969DRAFT_90082 [Mixia osmundae IAM 14324]|uniref:uncharacterized protein n=1 Tax=Mixia osmundae (strain CBS 9802 / IAM 14324 / JCM 22182 / KY 12970) TaxID=764103 RepID=UPI0004A54F46|nr:uncharacterized protein L969DRAFT_90082 [Mixia osmundae IAM 14324]KEI37021.1 hypothetical protein L969DRAFT_90082 [Mixia osmundae IAM 14324]
MSFSPAGYLQAQGWQGAGQGLQAGSRAKPITLIKKKDQSGLGKDRDEAYPWWDDVFANVAKKIPSKPAVSAGAVSPQSNARRHTTVTGLISPLPAPATSHSGLSTAGTSIPSASVQLDVIAQAKRAGAKAHLYSRFSRGATLTGSHEASDNSASPSTAPSPSAAPQGALSPVPIAAETADERRARRKARKARRLARAQRRAARHGGPVAVSAQLDTTKPVKRAEQTEPSQTSDSQEEHASTPHTTDKRSAKRKRKKCKPVQL